MSAEETQKRHIQYFAESEGMVQGFLEANPGHYPLGITAQDYLDRLQSDILAEIREMDTESPRFFELAKLLGKITALNALSADKDIEA